MSDNASQPAQDLDAYLAKMEAFANEQMQKTEALIQSTQEKMQKFQPFSDTLVVQVDEQMTALMESVNSELEKAMQKVDQQMETLQSSSDASGA